MVSIDDSENFCKVTQSSQSLQVFVPFFPSASFFCPLMLASSTDFWDLWTQEFFRVDVTHIRLFGGTACPRLLSGDAFSVWNLQNMPPSFRPQYESFSGREGSQKSEVRADTGREDMLGKGRKVRASWRGASLKRNKVWGILSP
jgi:hypothetical protein